MLFSKENNEEWNRLTPEKRQLILNSAYKDFFRSGIFPWMLCANIVFVGGLIAVFVWSLADHYNYPFAFIPIGAGVLSVLGMGPQVYALMHLVHLRCKDYLRKEIGSLDQ